MKGLNAMENSRIGRVMLRIFTSLGLFLFGLAAHTSAMEPEIPTPTDQPQTLAAPTGENFKQAADYSARHGGCAVLVMVAGKSMFERYDNGFGPDTATHLHSATKGFWGPVIAAMIEDGLIESYDELATRRCPNGRTTHARVGSRFATYSPSVPGLCKMSSTSRATIGQRSASDLYNHAIRVWAAREPGRHFSMAPVAITFWAKS